MRSQSSKTSANSFRHSSRVRHCVDAATVGDFAIIGAVIRQDLVTCVSHCRVKILRKHSETRFFIMDEIHLDVRIVTQGGKQGNPHHFRSRELRRFLKQLPPNALRLSLSFSRRSFRLPASRRCGTGDQPRGS